MLNTKMRLYSIVLSLLVMLVACLVLLPVGTKAQTSSFQIDIQNSSRSGDEGTLQNLGTFGLPSNLQEQSCTVDVASTNDQSVHQGNKLHVDVAGRRITIDDVENEQNASKTATGTVDNLPDTVNIWVEFGQDGQSSFRGSVSINCNETKPTSTPTISPTPTTGATVTISPTQALEVSPSPTPTARPTQAPSPTPTTCTVNKPQAPELLSVERVGNASLQLTWSEPSDEVENYQISYGHTSGEYSFGVANTSNSTSYKIGSLDLKKQYYFIVRAQNGCAISDASNELGYPQSEHPTTLADTDSNIGMHFFQVFFIVGAGLLVIGGWRMYKY